ncbi:MAG: hypothetical protein KZQ85_10180 [Candidatus Thiodiazotropha sp. (ex Myrtea sp. 'scaly one' KF741663)]|nr:hypothetical protein [Candidatus Thiodiazotropha sp. (ex Myrtea sp. 'scaly one' KF741663)]
MAEYSLVFSENLISAASILSDTGMNEVDEKRTVLYLSLLSSEISIKALLEQAGIPVQNIVNRRHKLVKLLGDLSKCEYKTEIANGVEGWACASAVRAITVDEHYGNATIGTLLSAEEKGAAQYPNEIRYGEQLYHYPAELVLKAASLLNTWAKEHFQSIRLSEQ